MLRATNWVRDNTGPLLLVCLLTWGGLGIAALVWALDDEPPAQLLNYSVTPAYPGGTMLVTADVWRDLARKCTSTFSRQFVDSHGATHAVESDTTMSAASIRVTDARTPGKLVFTVPIERDTPPGKGTIITPFTYTCNPWHSVRPLALTLEMQAEVLAP